MSWKRTEPRSILFLEYILVVLGRPVLYTLLYSLFVTSIILAYGAKKSIQLFKALSSSTKSAIVHLQQFVRLPFHAIRLLLKKHNLIFEIPIRKLYLILPFRKAHLHPTPIIKLPKSSPAVVKQIAKRLLNVLLTFHLQINKLVLKIKVMNFLRNFHPKTTAKRQKTKKTSLIAVAPLRLVLACTFCIVGGGTYYFIHSLLSTLPNPNSLVEREQIVSTKILDRNGKLLYKIYKNENRSIISLEKVPQPLIQATVAIEDKEFYSHIGYSYTGIVRAFRQTVFEKNIQGGSTITQQLVKNTLLTGEQTIERKVKEIILAILVESKFTKDEILTMYFNEVGYGGAAYGIEEASELYFGKSTQNLSLAEASLLAGLPAAPTYYSPFGTHPERAKFRQHEVLRRMCKEGYISKDEMEKAKNEKLIFSMNKIDISAPHFVMYVKEKLVEMYGEQMVEQGGLEVTTTLDLSVQDLAQKVVTEEVNTLEKLNVTNGAALVTNPTTGEIIAMVGSKDYFDTNKDGQVNVTVRPRQPGSAIKPVNYAVALENGYTAATMINDSPSTFLVEGQPPYSPKNYDNTYHGNITLRQALANSYNIPAVKTLANFSVEKMREKGEQMGIKTWEDEARFGLSLTLGGGEVTMTDLAEVYGSLANNGYHMSLQPILKVIDYHGNVLFSYHCQTNEIDSVNYSSSKFGEILECNPTKVVKPEVAYILTNILSDNEARSQAFGRYSVLNIPKFSVAVKTGTTQNLRDNWTIGYTPSILVAAWVGNNDNTPMSYVASGITGASPIWNKIMSVLLANNNQEEVKPPESIVQIDICPYTGTLPCEGCPRKKEYFIKGTEPTTSCPPNPLTEPKPPDSVIDADLQAIPIETIDLAKDNRSKNKLPGKRPR